MLGARSLNGRSLRNGKQAKAPDGSGYERVTFIRLHPRKVAVRIHSLVSSRLARAVLLTASLIAVAGCSGGSGSSGTLPPPNNFGVCDPGTQVTLANPQSGQTGVSTGTNPILIVANGNNNTLFQSYTNFDLVLVDNISGNRITSNALALTQGNGYKPYTSDFYYSGSLPQGLNFGTNYSVYLNIFSSNCQQLPFLGSFST